jgi:O-antigen/teichoic acid export membrane protein
MPNNQIEKILNSKFISRSKIIFFGSIISQAIIFLTSFIIIAFYSPEEFGLLGTLTALISIIAGTLSFRFEIAIIQAKKEEAPNIFFQTTLFSCFCSTLFCLTCFFLPWEFAKKITSYFFPFLFWTWGYFLFFHSKQLPFKFDELQRAASGSIIRNGFIFIYQLLGLFNPSFEWLLSGRIAGDYVGSWVQLKTYLKSIDLKKSTRHWSNFIKNHKDFFLYMTPHHLCIELSNNIVIFFMDKSFGLASVGFFTLAQRLIMTPLEVLGSFLINVTAQRFSEFNHDLSLLRKFYLKVTFFSLALGIISGMLIYGTIDFFIPILGPKWLASSEIVKNLIPLFITTLFISPTMNFLRFVNKTKIQLVIEVVEVLIKITFLATTQFTSPSELVLYYGVLSALFAIIKTLLVYILFTKPGRI